jgi:nucleoid-associated protein YgaU
MTKDAKVGMLLGLVFIFMIAFVVKGLPSFGESADSNELTTTMVSNRNASPGISGNTNKAEIIRPSVTRKSSNDNVNNNQAQKNDSMNKMPSTANSNLSSKPVEEKRFSMPLPSSPAMARNVRAQGENNQSRISFKPAAGKDIKLEVPARAEERALVIRSYVVKDGDSLSEIAAKFYGADKTNMHINVKRIFDANRKDMDSVDEIFVGQKLVIPALGGMQKASVSSEKKAPSQGSLLSRLLPKKPDFSSKSSQSAGKVHVVGEGESLWVIAAKELGDGKRYVEIIEMNTDILDDEDMLVVGSRLRLPGR